MPRLLRRLPIYVAMFCAGGISPGGIAAYEHKPDFDDYRKLGSVIEKYSHNKENNTYGVTLRVRENGVRALADGKVVSSGRLRGYGRYVIVDHGEGWHSLYSHLARIDTAKGREVKRGTVIGLARHKRLFLVVSYRGNPINPSEVMSARIYSEHLTAAND
ncbi:MAG: M23 family metallopeptidase [Turneriella sp.]|nr:M23 family metallopeptidase [Turneriella sp.]